MTRRDVRDDGEVVTGVADLVWKPQPSKKNSTVIPLTGSVDSSSCFKHFIYQQRRWAFELKRSLERQPHRKIRLRRHSMADLAPKQPSEHPRLHLNTIRSKISRSKASSLFSALNYATKCRSTKGFDASLDVPLENKSCILRCGGPHKLEMGPNPITAIVAVETHISQRRTMTANGAIAVTIFWTERVERARWGTEMEMNSLLSILHSVDEPLEVYYTYCGLGKRM